MTEASAGASRLAQEAELDPRRWKVLVVCLVAGFMTLLDVSIVNVALPSMQAGLGTSPVELAWVVSGYALTFGLVLVPSGRLGDDRGRSRMFLLSLVLFTATSALAGFAVNPAWLVVSRLLQGMAGGMLNPQVLGLLQQMFRGRERGKAFGLFGAVVGISTAVGPLLGGLILQFAGVEQGWRWVFFVNVPIGVAGLLYGWRVLPKFTGTARGASLDLVGVLLLGAGLVSLLLPLVEQESGSAPWYLVAAAPVLLGLFVAWERRYERRGRSPLVNLRLFRIRSYAFGSTLGLVYFAGFTSIFFVLAVYLQRGLGYTPLQAGLTLTSFAVGSAVASALGGRIVHRTGRKLVVLGLVAAGLGLLATDLLLRQHLGSAAGLYMVLPLLVAGTGSGFVISPNQTVTLSEVDTAQGGTAAGVQQTGQRLGSSLGIAAASGVFFSAMGSGWDAAISAGMVVSVCFVAVALVIGIAEMVVDRPAAAR